MAIQPIDLQTLFTQLDKVGKNQASQREGAQIQQALQGQQSQQRTEERIRSVNEAQNTGEGAERVKDRNSRGRPFREGDPEKDRTGEDTGEAPAGDQDAPIIRDPGIGRNIDFSG
jgi:hypothetical protein